ncbi:hypothetical protein C8Q78DRAFT_1001678 [Trametes maxima]|nr:hypothetical protein C8Q78DRAFT_1001678 [Trametes maxima]
MPGVTEIPTEIWQDIITQACTDGGLTGRSLALTSTFFRSQSMSPRFHSVALYSLKQLEAFMSSLSAQPIGCTPRIEHLCLSFANEPIKPPRKIWRIYSGMTQEVRQEYREQQKKDWASWTARFRTCSIPLLTLVAPTLRTLCVIEDGIAPLPLHIPCALPKLQELSWMGLIEAFKVPNPTVLPALKRVHFLHYNDILPPLPSIVVASSSLTHLRISDVTYTDDRLLGALAGVLGVPSTLHELCDIFQDGDNGHTCKVVRSPVLPHLQRVIVHAVPPSGGGWCGSDFVGWDDVIPDLQVLAKYCERHLEGLHILAMARVSRHNFSYPERLRNDWMDRVQGGSGCWVETEEDEAKLEIYEDDPSESSDEGGRFFD